MSDGHLDLAIGAFPNLQAEVPETTMSNVRVGSHAWAIRTATRVVMVDAGSGRHLRDRFPDTGWLIDRNVSAAPSPEEVTDVIVTHMHLDHIGGLWVDGRRRFPNATLHVSEAEWAFWTDPNEASRIPEAHRPLGAQIAALVAEWDYDVALHGGALDLGEGISTEPAPGHTPGHVVVRVASGYEQALILADAMICAPMQLAYPGVTYALDVDPQLAVETRKRCFDGLAVDDVPMTATHLTTRSLGKLSRIPSGYQFHPI